MATPHGYNNPAYCHQYDSSVCDYRYVPETDPDSPDFDDESNRMQTDSMHSNFERVISTGSEEFDESEESNGSIIIEECNNRRVTLICEKRHREEGNATGCLRERNGINGRIAYYQDVSLESENGYDRTGNEPKPEVRILRHRRPLEPPLIEQRNEAKNETGRNYSAVNNNEEIFRIQRPQRYHRYEEIPGDEDRLQGSSNTSTSVHRYAEISVDENGFPTLKKPIEIQKTSQIHLQNGGHTMPKPRAISPTDRPTNFSPPRTPSRTPQRTPYSRVSECSPSRFSRNSPTQNTNYPTRKNSYEMAELSPPRTDSRRLANESQTFFIESPKRQPPIGASASNESQDPFTATVRCILPSHLQKNPSRWRLERSRSAPSSPKRTRDFNRIHSSPGRNVIQMFHMVPGKSAKSKTKSVSGETRAFGKGNSARRNIFNSFTDPPSTFGIDSGPTGTRSPYKPTTTEINQPKTAIITPIFQRKTYQVQGHDNRSPKRNFEKMSRKTFQSTGNLCKVAREQTTVDSNDSRRDQSINQSRMKRNRSVPNFAHTFATENGFAARKQNEISGETENVSDFRFSPKKVLDNVPPAAKSRLSLLDRSKSSWTNSDSEIYPRCSACFIVATVIHLVTATATCAIGFYLLSKIGRKYYLDFGILAGFVNFVLGLLGFRSYCWRWLPNRNYVAGFIGLAAFSALTCAGLSYIVMAKPLAGNPVLDIMGGAICAVSVLTILTALTGLTMSGCCKTPPPDNRVTDL